MSDFTQFLQAVVNVDDSDPAACSVLREALGDSVGDWDASRMERLRSAAIEERRLQGDTSPELVVDSLLNGHLSEANP